MSEDGDGRERWLEMGQPEAVAARESDESECKYEGCDNDADYLVEFRTNGGDHFTTYMCDWCSADNAIWVRENGLLENEVVSA